MKSLLQNRIARRILLLKTQTRMMRFKNQDIRCHEKTNVESWRCVRSKQNLSQNQGMFHVEKEFFKDVLVSRWCLFHSQDCICLFSLFLLTAT